jgi:hypothetical protein
MIGMGANGVSPGIYGAHGSGVAVHLAGAAATGAVGVFALVPFDATNDDVSGVNASLSGGIVTVTSAWNYCIGGAVTLTASLGMTGLGIQVYRSGVNVAQPEIRGLTLLPGDVVSIPWCVPILLNENDTVEVWVASFGAGAAALVPGRTTCFLTVEAI